MRDLPKMYRDVWVDVIDYDCYFGEWQENTFFVKARLGWCSKNGSLRWFRISSDTSLLDTFDVHGCSWQYENPYKKTDHHLNEKCRRNRPRIKKGSKGYPAFTANIEGLIEQITASRTFNTPIVELEDEQCIKG